MKLLRITLENYRGIERCELRPAQQGVTVVLGPNEVGKSSLPQALHLLFQYPHDSKHRDVVATKPVHRDVGARIEVELETGPYHLVYEKQFHRQARAQLQISAPKPENLTGREAHERAQQILEETLDEALWTALSVEQGKAQDQPALKDQHWLSRAFDKAAGSATSGEGEASLFARAEAEYGQYFTATGKEKEPLTAPTARLADLEQEAARLRASLAALERDVEDTARWKTALQSDREAFARESAELRALEDELAALRSSQDVLQRALADERSAGSELQLVDRDVAERAQLVQTQRGAHTECRELERRARELLPDLELARGRLADARAAAQRSAELARSAGDLARSRAADHTYLRDLHDLQDLATRREHLNEAEEQLAKAHAVDSVSRIDADSLAELRRLAQDVAVAEGKASTAAARVQVRARRALELEVDGARRELEADATLELHADRSHSIALPDALELVLQPGADAAVLAAAVDAARVELRERLHALQVNDLPDAERAFARRRDARSQSQSLKKRIAEQLRDLTREALDEKLARLRAATDSYPTRRASNEPLPASTTLAATLAAEAETERRRTEGDAAERERELRDATERHAAVEKAHAQRANELEAAMRRADEARTKLELAHARESDEALAGKLAAARKRADEARDAARAARVDVERRAPSTLETRESNKRHAVEGLRRRIDAQQTELTKTLTRLETLGQDGLAERAKELERHVANTRDELERTRARAAAARLLFETLREERERERRAYVAPLEQRIASLGRIVYGATFQVTLEDELSIRSRTLEGVTVPFESLSTGAKEQLGVLTRLACAQIVADDGGVPLILDDVLGHTDPERLDKMSAVLRLAGKSTQLLLLTSSPERYRGIGGAQFIELNRSGAR